MENKRNIHISSRQNRFYIRSVKPKTKGVCCFSAEQAALRMKTKDCLARNLSVHRNITCSLFSSWYSWKLLTWC